MSGIKTLSSLVCGNAVYYGTGRHLSIVTRENISKSGRPIAQGYKSIKASLLHTHCRKCLHTCSSLSTPDSSGSMSTPTSTDKLSRDTFHGQPPSWLFISNAVRGAYNAQVSLDLGLNIRLFGDGLAELQDNLRARKMDLEFLDGLIEDYCKLKEIKKDLDALLKRNKELAKQITQIKQTGVGDLKPLFEESYHIREKLRASQRREELWDLEEKVIYPALKLPNSLHHTTPTDDSPVVIREKEGVREPQSVSHVEAGEKYNLIKFSNVGPKAYYLKGELAVAEWAISDLACDYMNKKGYRLLTAPEFFKTPIVEGCGRDIWNKDEVLTLQHSIKDIVEPMEHLAGISRMTFAAYLAKLCISDKELPLKFYSCGKTYQKSNLPGLFGALQSTQVGLFSCIQESDVEPQFEECADVIWKLLQSLGFSVRLSLVPAAELRREERRRLELQVYAPSLHRFISIGHVSDLGDFVSRRLMTCHSGIASEHHKAQLLHMISGTVVNITSLLAVWVEHTDLQTMGLGLK